MAELSFRQEIRIEALTSAARISKEGTPPDQVIAIAEQFAQWIGWGDEADDGSRSLTRRSTE